eukprot:g4471.t1
MKIVIVYRGTKTELDGDDISRTDPISKLVDAIRSTIPVDINSPKIILKGKRLDTLDQTLCLQQVGFKENKKHLIFISGSSSAETKRINEKVSEEERMAAARVEAHSRFGVTLRKIDKDGTAKSHNSKYGFVQIKALPNLPAAEKAQSILKRLGNEVGIHAVMQARKWRVGLLTELLPKGLVGVSETCLMGLNVNKGQEIKLRLRTDDMKGFRKYESIKAVLFHELCHNEIGPHNDAFHRLNREIIKQARQLDWSSAKGRVLGNGNENGRRNMVDARAERMFSFKDNDGEKVVLEKVSSSKHDYTGGSGVLGGDKRDETKRDLCALAAIERISLNEEEQEIVNCCGSNCNVTVKDTESK